MKVLLLTLLATLSFQSQAAEVRCGWIENPTPANFWITDNAGTWVISSQGGYEAKGVDLTYPNDRKNDYVHTNGSYGYWCGCIVAKTDTTDFNKVIEIYSSRVLKLDRCLQDKNLNQEFRPNILIHSSGKAYTECEAEEEQIGFKGRKACVNKTGEYYFLANEIIE